MDRAKNKTRIQYGYFSCAVIVLFTVYSIHIKASILPSVLTLRNICIVLVVARCFLFFNETKGFRLSRTDFTYLSLCLFEVLYANVLPSLFGVNVEGNYTLATLSLNYMILVVIFPLLFENAIQDTKQFARCIAIVSVIQALICIMSFAIPSVRDWIFEIQDIDTTSEDFANRAYRLRNFGIGLSGAGGSMTLLCGFVGAMYSWLFIDKKWIYIFEMAIITVGTVLIGRTGFYAEVILIIYMIIVGNAFDRKGLWNSLKIIIAVSGVVALGVFLLGAVETINSDLSYTTFRRITEIFRTGMSDGTMGYINSFWGNLDVLSIPEFLFGTGVSRGISSKGLEIWYDCGYIQRLFAVGFIPALIAYLNFFFYLNKKVKVLDRPKRLFFLLCIILMFGMEYKEACIYKLSYSLTIVMFCRLAYRDKIMELEEDES